MSTNIEVVALTSFVHGPYDMQEGHVYEVPRSLFLELEAAGFLRAKTPTPQQVATGGPDSGKAKDDGAGRPSSASPPAPRSWPTTSELSTSGGKGTRRGGR